VRDVLHHHANGLLSRLLHDHHGLILGHLLFLVELEALLHRDVDVLQVVDLVAE